MGSGRSRIVNTNAAAATGGAQSLARPGRTAAQRAAAAAFPETPARLLATGGSHRVYQITHAGTHYVVKELGSTARDQYLDHDRIIRREDVASRALRVMGLGDLVPQARGARGADGTGRFVVYEHVQGEDLSDALKRLRAGGSINPARDMGREIRARMDGREVAQQALGFWLIGDNDRNNFTNYLRDASDGRVHPIDFDFAFRAQDVLFNPNANLLASYYTGAEASEPPGWAAEIPPAAVDAVLRARPAVLRLAGGVDADQRRLVAQRYGLLDYARTLAAAAGEPLTYKMLYQFTRNGPV